MAELIFVRHAATSWSGRRFCGRADPPLNRAGLLAARRLAEAVVVGLSIGMVPATRIVSSPARRARQTAGAIARALSGGHLELDARWAEADIGTAEGLTFDELAGVDPELAERLGRGEVAIDWPGGESAASLAERVRSALRDLAGERSPTIVVSHAGPLRIAIALATNAPIEEVPFLEPGAVLRVADPGHR